MVTASEEAPRKTNRSWSEKDLNQLRELLVSGERVQRMAVILQRDEKEVRAKIADLGSEILQVQIGLGGATN